jgi:hypothetical protein
MPLADLIAQTPIAMGCFWFCTLGQQMLPNRARGCGRRPLLPRSAANGWFKPRPMDASSHMSPFRAPSVGATESKWVLLPRARDALLGGTFRGGTDKAESCGPAGRRALTPKQSPIEEGRKARHRTAGAEKSRLQKPRGSRRAKVSFTVGMSAAKEWRTALRIPVSRRPSCRGNREKDGTPKREGLHETRGARRERRVSPAPRD